MDSAPVETTIEHSGIAEKQITFGANGIKLNGKLFIPADAGKHNRVPGAVLCHGFGNEQSAFEVSAREMAGEGIISLTFDFRGHGESGGLLDGHMVEDVIDPGELAHFRFEASVSSAAARRASCTRRTAGPGASAAGCSSGRSTCFRPTRIRKSGGASRRSASRWWPP